MLVGICIGAAMMVIAFIGFYIIGNRSIREYELIIEELENENNELYYDYISAKNELRLIKSDSYRP